MAASPILSALSYLLYAFPTLASHDPLHTFTNQPSCPSVFLVFAFDFILGLVGIVALLMITVGGYKYMASGGDKYKVEAAQGTLTAGVIGLVVALVAFLLVGLVWSFITNTPFEPVKFLQARGIC